MDLQNKWAISGVFAAAAGALVGLAIWLSPGQASPAGTEIPPAGAEVAVTTTTSTVVNEAAVATTGAVNSAQPVSAGVQTAKLTTTKMRAQQPAVAAEVTTEPVVTATAATTLPPGQSSPTPPAPVCRWVYDGPDDHVGREVCLP